MKKLITLFSVLSLFTCSSLFAQLIVKDQESTPNTLLQVNDEGTSGSITLPSVGMSLSGTKFYNNGGNLYWGTNQLGLAGSAGGWTDDGSIVRLSSATDKVGIGTLSPNATFEVVGDDGVVFSGLFGSGSSLFFGVGTRMIWYPQKAAFRAGYTVSNEWTDGNIGEYSIATGNSTVANGYSSISMGAYNFASGSYSCALGKNTNASSYASTAIGSRNVGGGSADSWVETDPLFEIGNSFSGSSNAMTVLKNGNVGLGIHNPTKKLQVDKGNIMVQGLNSFQTADDEGILFLGSVHHYIKGVYGFGVKLGTYVAGDVISIKEVSGNVGINTTSPSAKLEVNGDVKIGSSGVKFSEIYELTSTTGVPGTSGISVPYPTNYNNENTRVVSLEIYANNNEWYSIGFYQSGDDWSISCALTSNIVITYPTDVGFNSQPFRLVLMKVE